MPRSKKEDSKKVVAMPTPAVTARKSKRLLGPTHAYIAARAYELYCERGCSHGHDVDDWLQAERELQEIVATVA
jgi:hypothetical protein